MNPGPLALVFVFAFIGVFSPTPHAHADANVSPACIAHIAGKNTTPAGDARYHLVHGGESPCKGSDSSTQESSHDESDGSWRRRDDFGFHCSLFHGCG